MSTKSSNRNLLLLLGAVVVIIIAALLLRFAVKKEDRAGRALRFAEHLRTGDAAFLILGDYFHETFKDELGTILMELPKECTTYIACNERMRRGLVSWTAKEGLQQPLFHTSNQTAPFMRVWARDVVLPGRDGEETTLIVSPNIHARTEDEAGLFTDIVRGLFPDDFNIIQAPFAFEAGNLIFIEGAGRRILLAGKKLIFDNERYQRRQWTPGWSGATLLDNIRTFFNVDSVVVVGLAEQPPPQELYFEYHLDMGMTVLREGTAVVAQFSFGEEEQRRLRRAVDGNDPIIASLFESSRDRDEVYSIMQARMTAIAHEYEHYAEIAGQLGLTVLRSPMDWTHVASWRSWTNVVQVGTRIFVPIYPDTLNAVPETTRDERGSIMKQLKLEAVAKDRFMLTGYNLRNQELYQSLGYDVVLIPEYLHYFGGGIHCFLNILY